MELPSGCTLAKRELMFGALIRAAERWRGLRFTVFELRQIAAVRKGLCVRPVRFSRISETNGLGVSRTCGAENSTVPSAVFIRPGRYPFLALRFAVGPLVTLPANPAANLALQGLPRISRAASSTKLDRSGAVPKRPSIKA